MVAHLEAARKYESVHRLLSLEASDGGNLWLDAKYSAGDIGGYVDDVRRALRLTCDAADAELRLGEPTREVGVEIRYALLIASVRGQAASVPLPLVMALVRNGVWSPDAAVSSVRQIVVPSSRIAALVALAPHVPASLLEQDFEQALAEAKVATEPERTDLLSQLAPCLPSRLLTDALETTARLDFGGSISRVLVELAVNLTPEHVPAALRAAESIEDGRYKAEALTALGPVLPAEIRVRAVAAAQQIREPTWRAVALAGVGERLSRAALRNALEPSPEYDEWNRAEALVLLALSLQPELLRDALAAARSLTGHRDRALVALAPYLTPDLIPDALEAVRETDWDEEQGKVLAALAPRLSDRTIGKAMTFARAIEDPQARIQALSALAQLLPQREKDKAFREALKAASAISFYSTDAIEVIVNLIENLPDRLLMNAVAIGQKRAGGSLRVEVLTAAGARLSEPARGEILREALAETRYIEDEWGLRARALANLARVLPREVLPAVVSEVRVDDDEWRFRARVAELAPFLEPDELPEALRACRELRDGRQQCIAIGALADYLDEPAKTEVLRDALIVVQSIEDYWDRTMALNAFAAKLPPELASEALTIAEDIKYEAGARAIAEVAPAMPPALLQRAVAAARAIPYEHWETVALAALAETAEEPEKGKLLALAVEAARRIDYGENPGFSTDFLVLAAPDLPLAALEDAVAAARRLRFESRSRSLAALATRLSTNQRTTLLEDALETARNLHPDESRAAALAELGPDVPGVIDAVREISDSRWRAVGLARLGKTVSEETVRDAIAALDRSESDSRDDVRPLIALLPFAPSNVIREALTAVARIAARAESGVATGELGGFAESLAFELAAIVPDLDDDALPDLLTVTSKIAPTQRAPVAGALALRFGSLPLPRLREVWNQSREALESKSRPDVLETLAPLAPAIRVFGGKAGVRDTIAAVQLVARWQR